MNLLCAVPANMRKKQQVYALRGPEATTELAMISALQSLKAVKLPLLPSLLQPPDTDQHAASSSMHDEPASSSQGSELQSEVACAVRHVVLQFSLNAEQAAVLQAMQPWFLSGSKVHLPRFLPCCFFTDLLCIHARTIC